MSALLKSFFFRGVIYANLIKMTVKQAFSKSAVHEKNRVMPKGLIFKVQLVFVFLRRMWKNNVYVFRACRQVVEEIMQEGAREVALCGVNDATRILCILLKERHLEIVGTYVGSSVKNKVFSCEVLPLEKIKGYRGKVIVASFVGVKEKIRELLELGIEKNNILRLL